MELTRIQSHSTHTYNKTYMGNVGIFESALDFWLSKNTRAVISLEQNLQTYSRPAFNSNCRIYFGSIKSYVYNLTSQNIFGATWCEKLPIIILVSSSQEEENNVLFLKDNQNELNIYILLQATIGSKASSLILSKTNPFIGQ